MRYMGGKFRQSKVISNYVKKNFSCNQTYVEPFCGMVSVASKVSDNFTNVILADNDEFVILLLKSLVNNTFVPYNPTDQNQIERDYKIFAKYKHMEISDINVEHLPMVAYWGYGMSFGGKWFAGLARDYRCDKDAPSLQITKNVNESLLKIQKSLKNIPNLKIIHSSYDELEIPDNSVVYLDPPYINRTKAYKNTNGFDHVKFWEWNRNLSMRCNVITTEYEVPDDFEVIHNWGDTVVRHFNGESKNKGNTNEVLVRYKNGKSW